MPETPEPKIRPCRLCSRLFALKPKGHRALYCDKCRKGKKQQWKYIARERKAATIQACTVCQTEIAGSRARSHVKVPSGTFCPMCFYALNSRRTPDQLRMIADLLEASAPTRRFSSQGLDSPLPRVVDSFS